MMWISAFLAILISVGIAFNYRSVAKGVEQGTLAPCPSMSNCVCSLDTNSQDTIEPLQGEDLDSMRNLVKVIRKMPRAKIVKQTPVYLHATFRSKIFRFVDDVEFLYKPEEGLIHVRSASRVGYNDFGVNRNRVEAVRQALLDNYPKNVN